MSRSINTASIIIPVMGPRITALGESDFINPQINPALQIKPVSFQICRKEIINMIEKVARSVPEKGICRLCRRLPTIISKLAHNPPATAAFSHMEFKPFSILLSSKTGWYAFEILLAVDIQEEVRKPAFHLL
jgi:hypothetical protein